MRGLSCREKHKANLHVKYAGGGIVDPLVNYSGADVVNSCVVVVLHPLGHLRELRRDSELIDAKDTEFGCKRKRRGDHKIAIT